MGMGMLFLGEVRVWDVKRMVNMVNKQMFFVFCFFFSVCVMEGKSK